MSTIQKAGKKLLQPATRQSATIRSPHDTCLTSTALPSSDPFSRSIIEPPRTSPGILHIAYHPVWTRERNDTKAWGPFLSRWLYTGGLSLQRAMFGIGDIESIGLTINPENKEITKVEYETAANYNPVNFSVKHLNVDKEGLFKSPLHFMVISWNHLFSFEEARSFFIWKTK